MGAVMPKPGASNVNIWWNRGGKKTLMYKLGEGKRRFGPVNVSEEW